MSTNCPACGSAASGKFCSQCGASLSPPPNCRECGNEIPAGGKYCNMCGTPIAAGEPAVAGAKAAKPAGRQEPVPGAAPKGPAPLIAAAVALAVVAGALALLLPRLTQPTAPPAAPPIASAAAPPLGDPSAIDLSSMTPEEAAMRLFNRVMTSVSAGDSASARQFAPMGILAYRQIPEPNLDALYHLALLHLVNNDPAGASAVADEILAEVPVHLFGLYTAAQARTLMGDRQDALGFYRRFLENFEAELEIARDEYLEHEAILPAMRDDATRIVESADEP